MAVAYIAEYDRMARDHLGLIQAGQEPSVANQTVAIGVAAQSSAFNTNTKFVCISTDAVCSVKFGANPTATTSSLRLPANSITYFGVLPGDKVSVIANT